MDATPVTLGQEFGGYAAAVRHGVERVAACLPRLGELPLGGTAVGTGINTPPGFAARVIERLAAAWSCRSPRRGTTSRPRAAATRWSRPAGCSGRSRSACTRSATTCAGWAPGRGPGWPRSAPRPAAGLLDHAGQGQPGDPRGGLPGVRPGDRQRRGGGVRRGGGQLRAERDDAGDRAQPARVDPAAGGGGRRCSPTGASPASPPTPSAAAAAPSPRRSSSPR